MPDGDCCSTFPGYPSHPTGPSGLNRAGILFNLVHDAKELGGGVESNSRFEEAK